MADSCYEESDVGESSEYESNSDSDDTEVEVILAKLVDLTVPDQDFGESSTQISHEENMPPANEEAIPSTDEDNTHAILPYKGQLFETLQDAKDFYLTYARKSGFGVRTRDSRREKARDNSITRLHLTCDGEGWHVKKVKPQKDPEKPVSRRNTPTQRCGCLAMFKVILRHAGRWVVYDFHETHNHNSVTPSKQICMRGRRHMPKAAKALVETFREINLPVGKVVTLFGGKTLGFDERDCYNHLNKIK